MNRMLLTVACLVTASIASAAEAPVKVLFLGDNGSDAPGTILTDCSDAFCRHFERADLIISKGQGNYETLVDSPRPIWFLLRVKCPIIARDLKCPVGTAILRRSLSRCTA